MKRLLSILLVAVLLFTAALPGLAVSGTQHGQTQEMQSAAIVSEPGSSTRTLLQTVWNRLVLLYQQIRALLGLGNETIRNRAQKLGIDLIPVPTCAVFTDTVQEWADAACLSLSDAAYHDMFEQFGFSTGDGGLPVHIRLQSRLREEEYSLSIKKTGVTITAADRRGVFCAVSTLAQLVRDGKIVAAEIRDRPAEEARGVIEGFYGQAWTHAFRLDLFSFMGKYKLNTYIYAPKDDPKHRTAWRELYTGAELERMQELIDCAAKNNVRFVYAISPGLDFDLGAGYDGDFKKLCDKCASLYDLGVRDFALLLDDIPTLDAKGHAKMVNDFQKKFIKTHAGCADLIMITPEYSVNMLTGYTDEIAKMLDRDIRVMWTGNGTVPQSITTGDLAKINLKLGRKVFIWWNYPVNDLVENELFMGPCENLDKTLYRSVSGFVSNPMNQGYASEFPLLTITDYLWNPAVYQPEASLAAALRVLAPDCTDALYTLVDLTRDTVINGNKSTFALAPEIRAYQNGADGAAQNLREALENTKAKLELLYETCEEKLLEEIQPWLEKALLTVDAAIRLMDFDLAASAEEKAEQALSFVAAYQKAMKNPKHVSPDVLTPLLTEATAKINALVKESKSEMTTVHVFTDLPTYQDYRPENTIDGNSDTFFWSSSAPAVNSSFTLDLGKVTDVTNVRLVMGNDTSFADYFHSGVLEYSEDGQTYTYLCNTQGRQTVCSDAFRARYVRVRCTGEQINWVIIQKFEAACGNLLPSGVSFDGDGETSFSPIFDRDLVTAFSPNPKTVSGKTLTIDTADLSKVELFLTEAEGLRLFTDAENGDQTEWSVTPHVLINTDGIRRVRIVFTEKQATIAEIVLV